MFDAMIKMRKTDRHLPGAFSLNVKLLITARPELVNVNNIATCIPNEGPESWKRTGCV